MQNPRFLSYMVALDEHRHFAKAARSLGITQPALSLGIKRLERELGVRLFDRARGRVEPTPFALAALRHARLILDENAELARAVSMLRGLEGGSLVVAAGTYPADLSGHRALGRFSQKYPGVHCRLELREWDEIIEPVMSRRADLALAETTVADSEPGIVSEVIGTHAGVFFCRPGHPLLRRSRPTVLDLSGFPWASVALPPRVAQALPELKPQAGTMDRIHRRFIPAIHVETLTGAKQVVRESDAISAAPTTLIAGEIERGELAPISFKAPWLRLHYGFIYLRDRTLSPAARAFMDEVRRVEASIVS